MNTSNSSQNIGSWKLGDHFNTLEVDGTTVRICSFAGCNEKYSKLTGHSTLKKHWEKRHQAVLDNQIILDEQDHIDKLYKWLVWDMKPFRTVQTKRFRAFAESMCSTKPIPSEKAASISIKNKVEPIQRQVISHLRRAISIGLTFDIWTSKRFTSSYGCVTAHYIDEEFICRSVVLEFDLFRHRHTGSSIAEFLRNVITKFEIQDKVIAITTDNASNNISALKILEDTMPLAGPTGAKLLHYRCLAHVLNLAVTEALKQLAHILDPIKAFVKSVRGSPTLSQEFEAIQLELNDDSSTLALTDNCPTRWNSTFLMLERVLRLRDAIEQAQQTMANVPQGFGWVQVEILIDFLAPFYEVTVELSGEKYPTITLANLFISHLTIHCQRDFKDEEINAAAFAFEAKLNQYEELSENTLTLGAALLDPRIKLGFIEEKRGIDILNSLLECALPHKDPSPKPKKRRILAELLISNQEEEDDEVKVYAKDSRSRYEDDPMAFWRQQGKNFPRLSILARKLFAIQATSVASERLFSSAGLIDTHKRNRLSCKSFRSCVLLKSWVCFFDSELIEKEEFQSLTAENEEHEQVPICSPMELMNLSSGEDEVGNFAILSQVPMQIS